MMANNVTLLDWLTKQGCKFGPDSAQSTTNKFVPSFLSSRVIRWANQHGCQWTQYTYSKMLFHDLSLAKLMKDHQPSLVDQPLILLPHEFLYYSNPPVETFVPFIQATRSIIRANDIPLLESLSKLDHPQGMMALCREAYDRGSPAQIKWFLSRGMVPDKFDPRARSFPYRGNKELIRLHQQYLRRTYVESKQNSSNQVTYTK